MKGLTADNARTQLEKVYGNEPFVHVVPAGVTPSTHQVRGTNDCVIGVFAGLNADNGTSPSALEA